MSPTGQLHQPGKEEWGKVFLCAGVNTAQETCGVVLGGRLEGGQKAREIYWPVNSKYLR